jgi:hypothetical protein
MRRDETSVSIGGTNNTRSRQGKDFCSRPEIPLREGWEVARVDVLFAYQCMDDQDYCTHFRFNGGRAMLHPRSLPFVHNAGREGAELRSIFIKGRETCVAHLVASC